MFENYSPELLKNRILERLTGVLQTREGAVTNDQVSGVAYELWIFYQMLDSLLPMFYVDETSGIYLDKQANDFGLTRKSGAAAHAAITFRGEDGVKIPAGMSFYTKNGLTFLLTADVVLAEGEGTGLLEAEKIGHAYNIEAGEIKTMQKNIKGLTGFENAAASGGVDEESDKDFLERYRFYLAFPPTSGNGYHYQNWGMEVDGVGAVRVIKVWDGGGTVKSILVSPSMGPVDGEITGEVQAHTEAECPVGAEPTVVSAKTLSISVTAAVVLSDRTNVVQVQAKMKENMEMYLKETVKNRFSTVIDASRDRLENYGFPVLLSRAAFYLMSIDGVLDYSDLRINGAAANVTTAYDTIPVIGEVTLT